jgi:hypothetical protein
MAEGFFASRPLEDDMKFLLGAVLFLILLYVIAGEAITSVVSLGETAGEAEAGRKLSYSPFPVTFREQYLCFAYDRAQWVMRGQDTGDDCRGPFIDSASLCRAMAEVEVTRVTLWEGRVLECD